jgi:hypothetical protein
MKWWYKAAIMKVCSKIQIGSKVYRPIQKHLGNLKVDPMRGIRYEADIAKWIYEAGLKIEGMTFF